MSNPIQHSEHRSSWNWWTTDSPFPEQEASHLWDPLKAALMTLVDGAVEPVNQVILDNFSHGQTARTWKEVRALARESLRGAKSGRPALDLVESKIQKGCEELSVEWNRSLSTELVPLDLATKGLSISPNCVFAAANSTIGVSLTVLLSIDFEVQRTVTNGVEVLRWARVTQHNLSWRQPAIELDWVETLDCKPADSIDTGLVEAPRSYLVTLFTVSSD
ncbi:hypothetical protein HD553DRAFT_344543 [Filobasidium floriforme]|uniref:uncharacterized protein n=1 Tax=Filobasidium floriforme TaxID=5210 RepID=UPI001E8CBAC1|nr:uncharacterized protein HD553DRAFT_344543 [Filobasidium floriforme]KAH8080775.1 hypothetical protein HD553DRAFT_344543 [Filobasidium floriforme]